MSYSKINTSINEIAIDKLLRCNYRTTIYKNNIVNIRKKYDKTIRLKSIFNVISGYAFSSKDYVEEGISIVRIGDLNNYSLNYDNMIKVPQEYYEEEKYKNYIVKKEDILVSLTGDGNLKCLYYNDDKKLLLNQRVAILRAKSDINIKFYYWLLKSDFVKKQFAYYSNGKSQLNISPFDLANIKIPVIDENLQKSCMEKISPTISKVKKLTSNIMKINDIINEVFAEKFNYDENLINNVRKGMTYGTQSSTNTRMNVFSTRFNALCNNSIRLSARANSPIFNKVDDILKQKNTIIMKNIVIENIHNGAKPDYVGEGIPVVKTAYLSNNGINTEEIQEYTTIHSYENNVNARLRKNDILICNIGKCSCGKIDIKEDELKAFAANEVTIIRVDEKIYNSKFLLYFLRSVFGISQIEKAYTGTTNQIHLNPQNVEKFLVPEISLEEQQKVVDIIEKKSNKQKEIENQISIEQMNIERILFEIIK